MLALSETLMLDFQDDVRAKIGHLSGPRLELRAGGRALQQAFLGEVISFFFSRVPLSLPTSA